MTTTDIRVVRPSCERIFGPGITTGGFLESVLTNYFLSRPDEDLPMTKIDRESFVKKFSLSPEARSLIKLNKKRTGVYHTTREQELQWLQDYFEHSYKSSFVVAQEVFRSYFLTPETERAVYVFEGRFFDQFSKVDIRNLTGRHLPQSGTGCIVLPRPIKLSKNPYVKGSDHIDEVLFHVGPTTFLNRSQDHFVETLNQWAADPSKVAQLEKRAADLMPLFPPEIHHSENDKRLFVAGINNTYGCVETYGEINIATEERIEKLLTVDRGNLTGNRDFDSKDDACMRLVFNLLAYLKSGRPDIREFRNTLHYRGKSTVHVRKEDEELTRSKIFLVGFNWLKNPIYTIDGWHSKGYQAWRMCGPGRTEPRLVYFSPSFKQRRKGKEDIITEEGASEEDFTEI